MNLFDKIQLILLIIPIIHIINYLPSINIISFIGHQYLVILSHLIIDLLMIFAAIFMPFDKNFNKITLINILQNFLILSCFVDS